MAAQTTIVAGVFTHEAQAMQALNALKQAGFDYDQIGLAMPGKSSSNLLNDLVNLGVSRERATYYDQEFREGRIVVSVRPDGRDQEARDILYGNGGYDFDRRTAATSATATSTQATTTTRGTVSQGVNTAAAQTANIFQDEFYQPRTLRLREERLNVNKERVQAGEVRLHKEVVAEQKDIAVPVTHEEVVVEVHPVTGAAMQDNTPIGTDETIRVPVTDERVNVTKQTVVTGEVEIGKREVQETRRVTDTVRREEVRVEQEGNAPIHNTESDRFHRNTRDEKNR